MLMVLSVLIATFSLLFILYYKRAFNHWKKVGVPYLEPTIPFGNASNPFTRRETIGVRMKWFYDEFKRIGHTKHGGVYLLSLPQYLPLDPEMVKNIMQKDFHYFVERGFYYNERDDPLSANLFAIGGQKWKNLRAKLTPTFTSGKMKMMFETLVECGNQMMEAMDGYYVTREEVDIKDVLARFTTDIIGSCAFGIECNTFKSPDAEFRKYGKRIFEPKSKLESLQILCSATWPELSKKLGIGFFPKDSTEFFYKVVEDTVKYREANNITRKDMLQLMIELKNKTTEDKHDGSTLTLMELAAQAFVFFVAGFETSSTTMTFSLYELAKHQDIQERVREEIEQVLKKHDGKITYEAIVEMKYLQQVVDEALRKYPPLPFITRLSVKDYPVPDTDVVLPKGTNVIIPTLGLHHDPEYYPEPDKFDPERFSEENKHKINQFAYLPFGEGPRICIGLRFGMMQTKVGLAMIIKNYRVSLSKKTVDPFVMDPFSFVLTSETGIYLDIEKVL